MAADFKTAQPWQFYERFLQEKVRPDGRALDDFRKALLNIDSIGTAEGSAMVKLGNTTVLCGIKAEVAEPLLLESNKGFVVPNVQLPPLCSPKFRPGPPSDQAQVLSQFLVDTLANSKLISLESLCIAEGKAVWCLYADVICLNYDGNIQDASLIALLAALHNCRLPGLSWSEESEEIIPSHETHCIKIASNPVASTFAVFLNSRVIADPTEEEEELAATVLTIVTLEDGSLCSVQKPGGFAVDDAILQRCIERALLHGREIRAIIEALRSPVDS